MALLSIIKKMFFIHAACGMGLRADDPIAMKDFVLSVQHRHEELKTAASQSGTIFSSGKRVSFLSLNVFLDKIYF